MRSPAEIGASAATRDASTVRGTSPPAASKTRVRCAFFLSDLDGGGAQRTIINIIHALPRERVTATLVVGRSDGPARAWLSPDYPLINFGRARARSSLWPLRTYLAAERPDVLFATMVDANIIATIGAYLVSPRPALILRETNPHRARGDIGPLRRRAVRWAYGRADRIVALSEGVGRELCAEYNLDPARVLTIHNPVDVDGWRRRAQAAREGAPPWSEFGGNGRVLVAAGRLIRQKGFDLLLPALARCEGEGRRARLVILGEGPERPALQAMARELGLADRLLMPGFVADPVSWYAHGDLFVLPSRWEGFGHVIVEAMACGLPVIAFDCPYGPVDILRGEQGGILVPPGNVDALAKAIDNLLGAPGQRARLAAVGLQAADRFAPQRIVGEYARLIEEVANRS